MSRRKLKAADMFAGAGGFTAGAEMAGLEVVWAVNHWPLAFDVHQANHPLVRHERHNVFDADPTWFSGMPDVDVLLASPACVPPDAIIEMSDGRHVAMKDISVGDSVLTHAGRGRRVKNVWTKKFSGDMASLRLWGDSKHEIKMTDDHLVWVRRRTKKGEAFGAPTFVRAAELKPGDYVGFPRIRPREGVASRFIDSLRPQRVKYLATATTVHKASGVVYERGEHERDLPGAKVYLEESSDLWWLIGNYLGDGQARDDGRPEIGWSVGGSNDNLVRVQDILKSLGLASWTRGDDTNKRVFTSSSHLHRVCTAFGRLAHLKHIPTGLIRLEHRFMRSLIEGYLDADGSVRLDGGNEVWRSTSTSLALLQGIQRLCWSVGWSASISIGDYARDSVILGRNVRCKDSWEISIRKRPHKQSRTKFDLDDTHVWRSVRSVDTQKVFDFTVYDMEVEHDHTFCLPGVVVHNCQGFSTAATTKRGGQEMLRATAFTILAALDGMARRRKKPKLVIVENVRGFRRWSYDPDTPDGSQYRWWLNSIENHGYKVTDVLVDAADVGVPQNRQRLFIVASLGDKPEIPEPSEPHVGFRCCVDLDHGEWRQVDKLDRPAAKKRMVEARKHHPDDDAFLIHHDSYTKGRSLERPIGTITATTHQWGIVKRGARGKDLYRLLSVEEYRRAMAFPEDYVLPRTTTKAVELLGNAVCPPVAQYVIEHAMESIA